MKKNSITSNQKIDLKIISFDNINQFFEGDLENISNLINIFEKLLLNFLNIIEEFPITRNYDLLRLNAHKLRSSFGMFGVSTVDLEKIEYSDDMELERLTNHIIRLKLKICEIINEIKIINAKINDN